MWIGNVNTFVRVSYYYGMNTFAWDDIVTFRMYLNNIYLRFLIHAQST